MRNTLERRLARLEARAGINAGLPEVIVHRVVMPNGQFGGEYEPARAEANGRVWHRKAGETIKHFASRVIAEALKHNPNHPLPPWIIFSPAKEGDARLQPWNHSSGSDA
jgi:hypothetical protein